VLPDLLRDLGDPFPAVWAHLHAAHGPRDAARLFAKILGELETRGAVDVVPTLEAALTGGTPLVVARPTTLAAAPPVDVPASLREIDVPSGCAADYDAWLAEVPA
jgi:hypothetical protein